MGMSRAGETSLCLREEAAQGPGGGREPWQVVWGCVRPRVLVGPEEETPEPTWGPATPGGHPHLGVHLWQDGGGYWSVAEVGLNFPEFPL